MTIWAPARVVADFSGGYLSSDAGALLLRQIDRRLGLSRKVAACFVDRRQQVFVDRALEELTAQRLYGLALGYADINDRDFLRGDPLLAVAAGKTDPLAQQRRPDQRGKAPASPSTLNRVELGHDKPSRGHKISHRPAALEDCRLQLAVRSLPKPYLFSSNHETHETHEREPKPGRRPNLDHLPRMPVTIQCFAPRLGKQCCRLSFRVFRVFRGSAFCMDRAKHAREIVLDWDAMGHRLHGLQEGRCFNAYYDDYCYLPLYYERR